MKRILLAFVLIAACFAQGDLSEAEQQNLSKVLQEAGSSPVDFVRALEGHLAKFPESPKRPELERALVKGAIESKDQERIILYGEKVLAREQDDLQILERVARALLFSDGKPEAERALKYAKKYEELVGKMRSAAAPGRVSEAEWRQELDKGIARALALQARATGNLGKLAEAAQLAQKSYETYPTSEAARETGRWLARLGKTAEAIPHIADAFTLRDPKNTDELRAQDRHRMGELYVKAYGSEKGLGDLVLESYDRTTALLADLQSKLGEADPNVVASEVLDFTLTGVGNTQLPLRALLGKVVIFDFWATWCGPCRAQHPLYEKVKERYHANSDVVFLSVSTDEDRSVVEPFLKEHGWNQKVYFENGLSRSLKINSIPTTIILDKKGKLFSRMNGFLPDRFVDMLSDRIDQALNAN